MKSLNIFCFIFVLSISGIYAGNKHANGDTLLLDNGKIRLEFLEEEALHLKGLSSINKTWQTSEDVSSFLWQLSLQNDNGNLLTVNSMNASYQGVHLEEPQGLSAEFRWLYPLGGTDSAQIIVNVRLKPGEALSEWGFEAELPEGWTVPDLSFPILPIEKPSQSQLIIPAGWGASYDLDGVDNQSFNSVYPSSRATVQLMNLVQDDAVLYFATHDKQASLKTFSARVNQEGVELSNAITTSEDWTTEGRFELPWMASIAVGEEGWESAVTKWYRPFSLESPWGKRKLLDKSYPQWLLEADLWLTGGHTEAASLANLKKGMAFFGPKTAFHWYYWHHAPFDTKYPEYFPAKDGFQEITDYIHEQGSHVIPYINGRLWDTTTVSYAERGGREATVLRKDLSPVVEVYASKAPNAVICPTSAVWAEILSDLTDKIQGSVLGNDGVYYDQVASARALPCWNPDHGHPVGGGDFWVKAYEEIYQDIRQEVSDDKILATEQNAEPYLSMFDLFLMVNYPPGEHYEPVPLFPLIYSDRALLYGFYIFNYNDLSYRIKNGLNLLWGAQLNGGRIAFVVTDAMKGNAEYLRGLADFRKDQHDLFVGGRFLKELKPEGDNPELISEHWPNPSAAVRGALWKSKNGEQVALLVNVDQVAHEVVLPIVGGKKTLEPGECLRYMIDD